MFGRNHRQAALEAAEHATCNDFQKIFTEDMDGLHLLALLLTADEDLAAQCFVAGLEDSIRDNSVFRQWARSWSKRAIIKNAIKIIKPGQQDEHSDAEAFESGDAEKNRLAGAVTQLAPLERFVFVMSVLEGHSPAECSALLGCSMQEVLAARSQAMRQMASYQAVQLESNGMPEATLIVAAGAA